MKVIPEGAAKVTTALIVNNGVKRTLRCELLLHDAAIKVNCSHWTSTLTEGQINFAMKWFESNLRNLINADTH